MSSEPSSTVHPPTSSAKKLSAGIETDSAQMHKVIEDEILKSRLHHLYALVDWGTQAVRQHAGTASVLLIIAHLATMSLHGFTELIGVPGSSGFWPWLSTLFGLLAVPLGTYSTVHLIDHIVDRKVGSFIGLGGALRIVFGFLLIFGVLKLSGFLAEQPLPLIGRVLELSTLFVSIAVMTGLVFLGLGAADLVYQASSHARFLSTRLMMLLVFAAVSTFLWLSFLSLEFRYVLLWAVEKGHLEAYVAGIEKLEQAAPVWVGSLAGALSLELPFILLLAWRFGRNATRALNDLRRGFQMVGRGEFDQPVLVEGRDEVAQMQLGFNRMLVAVQEQRFLETAFGRYVSPLVLERLRETPERSHLAGERTVATVLFSDIRGFTQMSADLDPEKVISILNDYMSSMIEVIARYDGYINKFVGDAIMVVWGVPLPQEDHVERAVNCALDMQDALREQNSEGGFDGIRLEMGIGLNVGPLVAGNLGNERQVEFTVIGDSVNVSSRCCSAAGIDEVVVTQEILDALPNHEVYDVHSQGLVELKGKGEVELFRMQRNKKPAG